MNTKFPLPSTHSFISVCTGLLLLLAGHCATAEQQIKVNDAWVRASLPGQTMSAAYMTLVSPQDATLLRAESDATKSVELHSMSMQNGVMKMRMLDKIALPANKPVQLAPGGLHLMLFDLKQPLNAGQFVNFELTLKSGNSEFKQTVKVPVKNPNESKDHHHDSGHQDHSHHHH